MCVVGELEFVIEQLNDNLALSTAQAIAQYVRSRIFGPPRDFPVFEGS